MCTEEQQTDFLYPASGLVAVLILAGWAASFSRSCQSDGCIGIVFPAAGAVIALLVQLAIVLPLFCRSRSKAKVPYAREASYWAVGSMIALVVPMLFIKW
jgi:hypothetical protein